MKLTFIEKSDIPKKNTYIPSKLQAILEEFVNSDAPAAIFENPANKTAINTAGALRYAAKRFGFNGVRVLTRKGKVYIVKEENK